METFVEDFHSFSQVVSSISLSKKGDVRHSGSNVAGDEEKICGK